jgi:ribosome-binding factor A
MPPSQRQMRVNSLLQEEISLILQRELMDPELSLTTITGVEVAPDLRSARVYFSALGEPQEEALHSALAALLKQRKLIQRLLADNVDLRYTPKLFFVSDTTAARAQELETLLHRVAQEPPLPPLAEAPEGLAALELLADEAEDEDDFEDDDDDAED